jgi:prepilin-type N-terminal cleavage/methylation domain-containing protein
MKSGWWRAGFTLFEIMVVLLILGIVSMLGWPALNEAMGDSRLAAAAEEVANAFEFAQMAAISSGRKTRVVIGAPQDSIAVRQHKATADLFSGGDALVSGDVESKTYEYMYYPLNKGTKYLVKLRDDSRFRGVDIKTSNFNQGAAVHFDTLGAPSKGGTVRLALRGRQMVVKLDALTGKVTVSR